MLANGARYAYERANELRTLGAIPGSLHERQLLIGHVLMFGSSIEPQLS